MADLSSSFGIEAVELVANGGRSVTVRVSGRWRRRRPEVRGQAALVLEADAGRRRFPAMPEPPSLTGASPGTWRMSFSVPSALAASLPGRTFLQLGGVMVPLPVGEVGAPGAEVLEELPARGSEPAAESAHRRADDLAAEVDRLEAELEGAREQSNRLRARIAERDRRLRAADQHVHAERALRVETEQELARRERAARHDLRALHERVEDLERELARMRRAVDEAEHLAAVVQARRAAAEAARAEAAAALADARVPGLERDLAAARAELEAQRRRSARAYEAIALVRAELRQLRAPPPTASPAPAPVSRTEPVQAERLSAALARLRDRASRPSAEEQAATPTSTSMSRPGPGPARAPVRPTKSWLEKPFRTLARRDPSTAGRLLLALLPAQRIANPHPVAYDLILGDLVCAQVTVGSGSVHVEMAQAPRPPAQVDFQLAGDLADVARLLAAGRLRRRLPSRHRAQVRGDRRRLVALDDLVRAQLGLAELVAAGVSLDPPLALTVAAGAIDAAWTAGERFTIAHRDPNAAMPDAYLHVRDAREPLVCTDLPHGPVMTVVVCPPDDLLAVLAGDAATVEGDERPLVLLRQWLDRAQCG